MRVHTTLPNAPTKLARVQTVYAQAEYLDSTEAAIDWWNYELGVNALVLVPEPLNADIKVIEGSARFGVLASADPVQGFIVVHAPIDTYRAIRHELGHAAFWLDHDELQPESVMAPTVDAGLKLHQAPAFGATGFGALVKDPKVALMAEDKAAIECRLTLRTFIGTALGEIPCP